MTKQEAEGLYEQMSDRLMEYNIPNYMYHGILDYVVYGVMPGSFLRSVFENKLMESYAHADGTNTMHMREYANMMYNFMPIGSFGEEECIAWCERGGIAGEVTE